MQQKWRKNMKYIIAADTDIGNRKNINQDSICVKAAETNLYGTIVMAMVCDGMGGLDDGEVASAEVVKHFSHWFCQRLPDLLKHFSWNEIQNEGREEIKVLNYRIEKYGESKDKKMGTTLSAILIIADKYMIAHVGDTRIYKLQNKVKQLTEDHTYIAQELKKGVITKEEAEHHPKRNMLLQCIGASETVSPQILSGNVDEEIIFLICSDGFRHKISSDEMQKYFQFQELKSKEIMKKNLRTLIDLVKEREEQDNISAILIKACKES